MFIVFETHMQPCSCGSDSYNSTNFVGVYATLAEAEKATETLSKPWSGYVRKHKHKENYVPLVAGGIYVSDVNNDQPYFDYVAGFDNLYLGKKYVPLSWENWE